MNIKILRSAVNCLILSTVFLCGVLLGYYYTEAYNRTIQALLYRTFGDKTIFTELVQVEKLFTPQAISNWMMDNVEYKIDLEVHDMEEYWQTPLETLHLKTGDCEDYAFLSQELLNQIGIKAKVLIMVSMNRETGEPSGHAVCVFKWQWRWWVFDCGYLSACPSYIKSIQDIVIDYYGCQPTYWTVCDDKEEL